TGNATVSVPVVSAAGTGVNSGYDFLTPGAATTLTISSGLNSVGNGLMKYGAGTLVLSGPFYGSGQVTVAQGTLQLSGAAAALPPVAAPLVVQPGGTFDLGGANRTISSLAFT